MLAGAAEAGSSGGDPKGVADAVAASFQEGQHSQTGSLEIGYTYSHIPPMTQVQEVLADYRTLGLSLREHPMAFLRRWLTQQQVVPAARLGDLPDGAPVKVAGVVLVRQRPATAKGITFVTLEDETGQANLIIRPDVWQKWRTAALTATLLLAYGRLQKQGQVIHVRTWKLVDLSEKLPRLPAMSRDFC
jgi:error-prone DNA polymerase